MGHRDYTLSNGLRIRVKDHAAVFQLQPSAEGDRELVMTSNELNTRALVAFLTIELAELDRLRRQEEMRIRGLELEMKHSEERRRLAAEKGS